MAVEFSKGCVIHGDVALRANGWRGSGGLVTVSSPTVDPMDCSLPGSSVHEILQARTLEWVAMPSSRGSSQPRD